MRNLSSEPVTAKVYIASLNPHSPSFQAPTTFSSLPTLSSTLLHCAFSPLPIKPSMPSKRFQNLVRVYRRSFRHLVQGPWGGYRGVGKAGWRGSCRGPLDRSEAFKRAFCRGIAVGIGQGNIVHSGGDLGVALFRFVGYAVGDTMLDKKKGLVQ